MFKEGVARVKYKTEYYICELLFVQKNADRDAVLTPCHRQQKKICSNGKRTVNAQLASDTSFSPCCAMQTRRNLDISDNSTTNDNNGPSRQRQRRRRRRQQGGAGITRVQTHTQTDTKRISHTFVQNQIEFHHTTPHRTTPHHTSPYHTAPKNSNGYSVVC